jgi:SAM-dependent methyltransferase
MTYAELTLRDRNPVKRWIQRRRLRDGLALLHGFCGAAGARVLDFGAGDGEFSRMIAEQLGAEVWTYEPAAPLLAEAALRLSGYDNVAVIGTLEGVEPQSFDAVACLEVLEHLPSEETSDALTTIDALLKPGGHALIGVPHEIHLPALVKGLFRMTRRAGEHDARIGNVFAACRGRPPSERPAGEIAPGLKYFFHHLGFDHRALQAILADRFELVTRRFSPLPFLGEAFNSEVYFVIRKRSVHLMHGRAAG